MRSTISAIAFPVSGAASAFNGSQDHPSGTPKFELLSLAFGGFRQQRQLIQPLLRYRAAASAIAERAAGLPPSFAPAKDGFLNEPSFGIMLRE